MDNDKEIIYAIEEVNNDHRVSVNESERTKTITLSESVQHNGQELKSLTFRRPKGKDWMRIDDEKSDMRKAFLLASLLSGVPVNILGDLDGNDALLCVTVAGSMGKK